MTMRWASAISERGAMEWAVEEAAERIRASIERPDVIFCFASAEHAAQYADVPTALERAFPDSVLVGCSGGGVVGAGHEVEGRTALSLTAGALPDATIRAHRLSEAPASPEAWRALTGDEAEGFVLLADPFSFDPDGCLGDLDRAFPGATVVGGLASGGLLAGGNALFCGREAENDGAVLVSFSGNVAIDPIIAQGCKPIGEPMIVTSCEGNVIHRLDCGKPGEVLGALYESLDDDDRLLFRTSLFMGLQMRDQKEYGHGDFLVRNIVGMSPDGDTLGVGALLDRWQVVQLHLRDRHTAEADLVAHLDAWTNEASRPEGALLFSCLGRGRGLFGEPDHDSRLFSERFAEVPVGGFFCNGEIGPVGGSTFTHGYTSAFGLFRPRGTGRVP